MPILIVLMMVDGGMVSQPRLSQMYRFFSSFSVYSAQVDNFHIKMYVDSTECMIQQDPSLAANQISSIAYLHTANTQETFPSLLWTGALAS